MIAKTIRIKRCPSSEFVRINGTVFCKAYVRRVVGEKRKLYTTFRLVQDPLGLIVVSSSSPLCLVIRLRGVSGRRWMTHNNFESKFYAGPLEKETRFKLVRWPRKVFNRKP